MAVITSETQKDTVVIAVCCIRGILGYAVYDEIGNTLVSNSVYFNNGEDMVDIVTKIKENFTPTLFLLHPKIITNLELLDLIILKWDCLELKVCLKCKSAHSSDGDWLLKSLCSSTACLNNNNFSGMARFVFLWTSINDSIRSGWS